MTSLYRKALEVISKGMDWLRGYGYLRNLFPKDNPNDVHRAVTAAKAGRDVAAWAANNPGSPLSDAWETAEYIPYQPGVRWTREDLRGVFPQVVDGPYSMDVITNISGLNDTGFQRFRIYVSGGETWEDIRKELTEAVKEQYEFSGKVNKEIIMSFVIGHVR